MIAVVWSSLALRHACSSAINANSTAITATATQVATAAATPVRTTLVPDPTPTTIVPRLANAFTLGSSEDDVRRAMGEPQSVYLDLWEYPGGSVFFSKGKVVGFQNLSHGLRIAMPLPADYAGQPGVRVGATTDDVVAAQGAPDAVTGLGDTSMWSLGASSVDFSRGRVVGYRNGGNLRLGVWPRVLGAGASPAGPLHVVPTALPSPTASATERSTTGTGSGPPRLKRPTDDGF
jgi:hypothetical protein